MKTARQNMLAKVHIAKKALALSEADYRHVLRVQFGVESAADLNDRELHQLLGHFRRCGWPPRGDVRPMVPKGDRSVLIDKIEAQLTELAYHKGSRVPWSYAESILRRQTGNPHAYLNWATAEELTKIVQSLYYALTRANARELAANYARALEAQAAPEYLAGLGPAFAAILTRAKQNKASQRDYRAILEVRWSLAKSAAAEG